MQVYPSAHTYKVGSRTELRKNRREERASAELRPGRLERSGGGSSTPVGGVGSSGTGTPHLGKESNPQGTSKLFKLRVAGIGTPIGGIGAQVFACFALAACSCAR